MLAATRTAALRQLARVGTLVDANKLGIPGAKEEVRDALLELIAEPEEDMPERTAILKALGKAWYQLTRAPTPNKAAIKATVAEAIKLIQAESTGTTPPEEEHEPPPPPPPPPEEPPSGWKLLYEDAFPTIPGPFVGGGDNQASAIHFNGDRAVIALTGERYEFSMYKAAHDSSKPWKPGDRYRFEGNVEYASNIKLGGAGHHTTIVQFLKGIGSSGGGSPTQSIEIGNYGAGEGFYLANRGSYTKLLTTRAGQRYHVVVEVTDSTTKGSYRVYVDGALVASADNAVTSQGAESIAKFGLYGGPGTVTWDTISMSVPTLATVKAFFRRLRGA